MKKYGKRSRKKVQYAGVPKRPGASSNLSLEVNSCNSDYSLCTAAKWLSLSALIKVICLQRGVHLHAKCPT